MKKVYKLTSKSFLGPFVLTFFIVVFILLMQFLWKYIDDLVGKGLDTPVIIELLMYTSASLVPMAIPLAVLLASLMTYGNMAEFNELLALKSAGIPLEKIMRPVMILVFFITIIAFLFNNHVLPFANLKMRSLLYDIQRQNPEFQIKPGVFDNTLSGYAIRIGEKDPKTNLLEDIRIYDHTERNGNRIVTLADSGYMKMTEDERYLMLTLYNGKSYVEMEEENRRRPEKSYPHRRDKFEMQQMIIELVDFGLQRTDENLFKSSYQMMNLKQLNQIQDSLNNQLRDNQGSLQRTLDRTSYYKKKSHLLSKTPLEEMEEQNDSTQKEENVVVSLNIDALYDSLQINDKKSILSRSLNLARTTRNYINNSFITADSKIRRLRKYEIEEHRKFALSMACLIFFFIGAPLGAIIRKGGLGMPVVVSVVFFLLYYIISLTSEKFVRESVIPVEVGMWISSLLLIPLGIFLTYKASTDSVIMNIETYFSFFKKIFKKRKKKFKEP